MEFSDAELLWNKMVHTIGLLTILYFMVKATAKSLMWSKKFGRMKGQEMREWVEKFVKN